MNNRNQTLKLCFVISLLLNLLLAGVIGGHIWWHIFGIWPDKIHELTQNMPPLKQQALAAAMKKIHDEINGFHDQIDAARAATETLFKADPFDRAAYLAAAQHIQALHAQMIQKVGTELADAAPNFTPPERAALADMLRASRHDRDCENNHPDNKKPGD